MSSAKQTKSTDLARVCGRQAAAGDDWAISALKAWCIKISVTMPRKRNCESEQQYQRGFWHSQPVPETVTRITQTIPENGLENRRYR
jgi:hypothetical protein